MTDWPHQTRAVQETLALIQAGECRILITSPTGGGKSRIAVRLIQSYLGQNRKVALYTNRRMLIEQLSEVLEKAGISHGVRAAGYDKEWFKDVQLCSIQSENSWSLKGTDELPQADLVLIDEAHLMAGPTAADLMGRYVQRGAVIVGLTATPIELGDYYDALIVAGTNSELRKCGALVPAYHFGPDEPDPATLKAVQPGVDLSEKQIASAIMRRGIHGRVIEWYRKLNPTNRPTILFAPSVDTSVGFAKKFSEAGIPAVHIDGECLWANGCEVKSTKDSRTELLDGSINGTYRVVCNRFVLREGIDAPWISHCIFATVFGALQSYLQTGGRGLRACTGKDRCSVQDHGGNWWRHGSLNADRSWRLDESCVRVSGMWQDDLREKPDSQPLLCPQCQAVVARMIPGNRCPNCQAEFPKYPKRIRFLVQSDGSLREYEGPILKPKYVRHFPDTEAKWIKCYWAARKGKKGMTFRQAVGWFVQQNHYHPHPTLPLMPKNSIDWYRRVVDVPIEELLQKDRT
jgi:superfamily II DNA or RNA helicase